MTHYRSDIQLRPGARFLALSLVALFAIALPSLGSFAALVTTDRYIIQETNVVTEDQYVTAMSAIVEGTIEGDLTVFTGSLTIRGDITGSVTVFSSGRVLVEETGSIGGSLNGSAGSVVIHGSVGGDVFVGSGSTVVEEAGSVGRDLFAFGGTARVEGTVERDLRGRVFRTTIDGSVGGDVDMATQSLSVGPSAVVSGDIVYRSPADAEIADGAQIAGTVTKLPTQSNFIYSLILSIANVVGFLGFVVAGLAALWLFRSSSARAVGSILTRPIRSLLVGLGIVIVVPFAVAFLAVTLVGIPLALVLVALAAIGFVVGAVPAVTALGNRLLFNRGGLFAAFLLGAVVWRLGIWLIPYVGGFLFVLGLVWGIGAWALGVGATRRADPIPAVLIPSAIVDDGGNTRGWEPPRAPGTSTEPTLDVELASSAAAAAVIADEVVTPTREQTAVEAPAETDADASSEALPEPDPTRERDLTHDDDAITFEGAPAVAAATAVGDAGEGEESAPLQSDVPTEPASSSQDDAMPSAEPVPEVSEAPESRPSLEDRLAALRRELDDAEGDEEQPFAEFFGEQEGAQERKAPRPPDATEGSDRAGDPPSGAEDGWGFSEE